MAAACGRKRNFCFVNGPISDDYFLKTSHERLFYQRFHDATRQFYTKDTFKLFDDRLSREVDFKGTIVKIDASVQNDSAHRARCS